MKVAVLIDYDNLLETHKISGVLDIVTKVLMQLPKQVSVVRGACDIRIYGGWYEGNIMSKLGQEIAVAIQNDFPAIIRIPSALGNNILLTATAELARALMEEPSHHLLNTYRKKGRPSNIRVQKPEDVGCLSATCPLPIARKLLKSGSCPVNGCATSKGELVYRHEQKIVDTMLTCDLIYIAELGYDYIFLVSGDDDFLPPLRTVLMRGGTIFRVHPQLSVHRLPLPVTSARLIELEL